ncbi:glycosyltransferase family 2 protein [Pedobacter cryoconitis]|uniref:Glycosyltransferase involved in cell wall biosynthesis n=1 Tax=Pedobacter cryoconitis TaxID=188932 RepID=A0A7X0J5W0_9SPHI|nr:glycosyltransferase family A protein [Pedobacter cryoconitis]MBB6501655.1 glycosyltransferase involved in cell wall biosynthesis [Pedobacter cryoconitis]
MEFPLVSCIMPTADRQIFIPYAIDYFLHQDYPNLELIIIDDGVKSVSSLIPKHPRIRYFYYEEPESIGNRRNLACKLAEGEIIVHWDDDDWYAQNWVSKQVDVLTKNAIDVTGLCNVNYFSAVLKQRWNYRDPEKGKSWVYGATLAYWKSFWDKYHFNDLQTGEDNDFLSNSEAIIIPHDYTDGYLGIIHHQNSGIEFQQDPKEKLQIIKWYKEIKKPEKCTKHSILSTSSDLPLVSCIMPTANRRNFIPSAIQNFLKQDYMNTELIIIDDGKDPIADLIPDNKRIRYFYFDSIESVGTKRNMACEMANGELITHWDDDDWYAQDWISHQVQALINSGSDICGINQVQFFSPSKNSYWMTKNYNSKRPWVTGASLIYRKSFWEKHPFNDLQVREDDDYLRNSGGKIFAHDYFQGFIATLHSSNTSIKFFEETDPEPGKL